MSKRILALLLALALVVGVFAACGDSSSSSSSAGNTSSTASTEGGDDASTVEGGDSEPANVSSGADDTSELYEFDCYWYYDWATLKEWGKDAFSKYMKEKFNVQVNFSKPDADQDSKLQLLLTGGDLPDAMILDRGRVLNNVVRAGALTEIEQFMYDGCTFAEDVGPETRELLKVDGKLYSIPNWPRAPGKASTGGNRQWMINSYTYNEAGKPSLASINDLHDYAVKVKEAGLKSYSGQDIIPVGFEPNNAGLYVVYPFLRATGARNLVETYFTQEDGKIELGVREPKYIEALKEANKWYREGLWDSSTFTDNSDQWVEKLTNGRVGLCVYDFSQDDTNNFRRTTVEKSSSTDKPTSYEVIGAPNYADVSSYPQWPAFDGVEVVYGDEAGSPGWNVNVITTAAERPQRIFDLFTWMISKEGSAFQVCGGPEGEIWDGEYDEDGLPKLNLDYGAITSAQQDAAGAWMWTQPAHSDYIDTMKFALNDKAETKNWVVDTQAHLVSYDEENPQIGQKFKTDQLTGLGDVIDPQDDLGISLKQIQDQCQAEIPKILMAKDDAEFDSLVEGLKSFCESNNVDAVIEAYQGKYDANIELQGFDAYSEEYDVYKLKG